MRSTQADESTLIIYTQDLSKCEVLGDLIFVAVISKKRSNSQPYCDAFSKSQAQKAIDQKSHFERSWVYSRCRVMY